LWGLGQRPNCFSGDQFQGNRQQRRRQRSVPASNFARPQTRPPSHSTNLLHIVAPNGRDRVTGLSDIAALFRNAGISLLRERGGGFALAPSTSSQCTLLLLNFYWSRENRRCCGDKGALRSPPPPLRSAHSCFLTFIGAGRIAAAAATRGLSARPLDPFGCTLPCLSFLIAGHSIFPQMVIY